MQPERCENWKVCDQHGCTGHCDTPSVQQLVARIKRSSKYAYQAPEGGWFDVRVVPDMGYGLRGNNNNYRFSDVVFGIRLENGDVVELRDRR